MKKNVIGLLLSLCVLFVSSYAAAYDRRYYYKSDLSLTLAAEGASPFIREAISLEEQAFKQGLEEALALAPRNGLSAHKMLQNVREHLESRISYIKRMQDAYVDKDALINGACVVASGLVIAGLVYYFYNKFYGSDGKNTQEFNAIVRQLENEGVRVESSWLRVTMFVKNHSDKLTYSSQSQQLGKLHHDFTQGVQTAGMFSILSGLCVCSGGALMRKAFDNHSDDINFDKYERFLKIADDMQKKNGKIG